MENESFIANYLEALVVFFSAYLPESVRENDYGSIISCVILLGSYIILYQLIKLIHLFLRHKACVFVEKRFTELKVQRQVIFSLEEIKSFIEVLARIVCYASVVFLSMIFFAFFLSVFEITSNFPDRILNWCIGIISGIFFDVLAYLPNIANIVLILVIAYYLMKSAKLIFAGIERGQIYIRGFYKDWCDTSYKIVRSVIIIMSLIMIFPYLPGSSSPAFKGISIFIGVLVSLGSSAAIGNIISGLALTYTRAFQEGDRVDIAGTQGIVIRKTLLVTYVRTPKNVEISIPNVTVMGNSIINYSSRAKKTGVILHSSVTIGYDVDWRKVHELLVKAANQCEKTEETPSPFVLQTALNDFYVSYEINAYTRSDESMPAIYSELHGNILDVFNEAGIEIMSPHFRANRMAEEAQIPVESNKGDSL